MKTKIVFGYEVMLARVRAAVANANFNLERPEDAERVERDALQWNEELDRPLLRWVMAAALRTCARRLAAWEAELDADEDGATLSVELPQRPVNLAGLIQAQIEDYAQTRAMLDKCMAVPPSLWSEAPQACEALRARSAALLTDLVSTMAVLG